jgi:HD-GYP domain-containing protein (c-di-GMP phosphodiesterase class II)
VKTGAKDWKRISMNNALNEANFRITELEDRSRRQTIAMACTLVSLIDLRDRYTGSHSSRVAAYCRGIAVRMGLPDADVESVVLAASLHDIGKIGVPDHVLLKPGKLDDEEFEWIRKHPEYGWMALRNVEGFQQESLMVLHHHERMDGKGYPGGLVGSQIPLGSRIIAVADSFDALTTNRPYRSARTHYEAMEEIIRCTGPQFDAAVVAAFSNSVTLEQAVASDGCIVTTSPSYQETA